MHGVIETPDGRKFSLWVYSHISLPGDNYKRSDMHVGVSSDHNSPGPSISFNLDMQEGEWSVRGGMEQGVKVGRARPMAEYKARELVDELMPLIEDFIASNIEEISREAQKRARKRLTSARRRVTHLKKKMGEIQSELEDKEKEIQELEVSLPGAGVSIK